ncbi:MAG: hypothetical protein ACJA1E_001346 [Paracoccaceae bacterium]|jgi:hypothetical protein
MAISALLFSCYFLNVSMGAFGSGVILNDIQELLLLIVSVIFFVAAILLREAVKKTSDK